MWLLWDLRAPSIRPAHPQETTPILIHTHTHMHTDPQVYSSQAGVYIHIVTYQHSYTQEHMLAYTWHFKRKYGKSMLKIRSRNFLMKKKSDLKKNLIIVFLSRLWYLPFFFQCAFQYLALWHLLELEKFKHLCSETTFPETQLKNVYWSALTVGFPIY